MAKICSQQIVGVVRDSKHTDVRDDAPRQLFFAYDVPPATALSAAEELLIVPPDALLSVWRGAIGIAPHFLE